MCNIVHNKVPQLQHYLLSTVAPKIKDKKKNFNSDRGWSFEPFHPPRAKMTQQQQQGQAVVICQPSPKAKAQKDSRSVVQMLLIIFCDFMSQTKTNSEFTPKLICLCTKDRITNTSFLWLWNNESDAL